MTAYRIRPEQAHDADAITAVIETAFRTAPHSDGTEQHIVIALRRAGALSVSLVAEVDGDVVGHVAFSPVTVSDGSAHWYGLGPVSVLPAHRNAGIGAALVEAGLAALRDRGAAGCVVLGEPGYYGRFGFECRPDCVLEGVPPEYFQCLALEGRHAAGTVTYHAAFSVGGPG
ncbi:N-acetyltransferase [Algiphilus sp.]|uniref:GNAT family N-acetyltransferase n=1 Tax=Algiphilus sp. TaxID=1872431 RepID=UPI0025C47F3A|nr:N-acetyltransferase [Algiphilus sp.]MCK5769819.1 N-acetyltransferase [Algiphilus sp.]